MLDSEDRQALKEARLLANVGIESLDPFLPRCRTFTLARGDKLLEVGAANDQLFLILEGELRVYLTDRNLAAHAILHTGDCAGEISLIDGERVTALVIAAHDTRLLAMPHEVVWALVDSSNGVARNLLSILAGRLRNDNLALMNSQSESLEFVQASSVNVLTGVHNRTWMLDAYPRAITRCLRDGESVCLLLADIDFFGNFNERHGHLAGDGVLRRVARQLADGLRTQDLIARIGGEEFAILLPQTSIDVAMLIAERLRDRVASDTDTEAEEAHDGASGVTLSCGVAQLDADETLDALLGRAEAALHLAKENGRDRVETAS